MAITNKQVLLTILIEGGIVPRYNKKEDRYDKVPKIISCMWKVPIVAVEYYSSFDSRPSRYENKRYNQDWSRMTEIERLKYNLSVLAASKDAVSFNFELI